MDKSNTYDTEEAISVFGNPAITVSRIRNNLTNLIIDEIVNLLERSPVELRRERFVFSGKTWSILDAELPPRLEPILAHQLHSFFLQPFERLLRERFHLSLGPLVRCRDRLRRIGAAFRGRVEAPRRLEHLKPGLGTPRIRHRPLRLNSPRRFCGDDVHQVIGGLGRSVQGRLRRRVGRLVPAVRRRRHTGVPMGARCGPRCEAAWRNSRARLAVAERCPLKTWSGGAAQRRPSTPRTAEVGAVELYLCNNWNASKLL